MKDKWKLKKIAEDKLPPVKEYPNNVIRVPITPDVSPHITYPLSNLKREIVEVEFRKTLEGDNWQFVDFIER